MLFTDQAHGCFAKDPAVVRFQNQYFLYYSMAAHRVENGQVTTSMQNAQARFGIGIARSDDLENWEIIGALPETQPCESNGVAAPGAIVLEGRVHLFYQTYGNGPKDAICHAFSADGIHFEKDPANPVFAPTADWCNGRAIDADVCAFQGKLFLYFATRDHKGEIQKIGGAWAPLDSAFSRGDWQQIALGTLIAPEMQWEGQCAEAPAAIVHNGKMYLFYGGSYNCTPQQIGAAVSEDGCFFRKLSPEPFLPCGGPEDWNSSESGHPFAFRDADGRAYLFYQGSSDGGKTWYLSRRELCFDGDIPRLADSLHIRRTTDADLPRVMEIYARARQFMADHGNPNQWGPTNWPPEALIRQDILEGKGHVCIDENGRVIGTFYYDHGPDIEPTYRDITEGAWRSDAEYGVVHRIASDGSQKGIGEFCIRWAMAKSGHLRIDTHGDNRVMQNLLTKLGFEKRGIIYVVEDNYPRFAYEIG